MAFSLSRVIAAVRNNDEMKIAVGSKVAIIFDLYPDILTLSEVVRTVHSAGKRLFIHLDLAEGLGKDKAGILYAKSVGTDGIISTRVNLIKLAKECGMMTVQRFFVVDSHSVETTMEALKSSKPDMIEIMPGVVPKIVRRCKESVSVPVIAGGLIESRAEITAVLKSGAFAVSTGKSEFWNLD